MFKVSLMKRKTLPRDISLLESVLDATPDGISVLDPDLNIVWVNPTIKKWYPRSEPFSGCKCYRIYHLRKHPCQNCPAMRALESCEPAKEIVPLPKSQQGTGWLELYAFPLLDVTGVPNGVVEYVRNITDRVTIEQALRNSEQRYRIVADFTYDWEYWIAPDGNYIYVSPSCERITGYPAHAFFEDAGLLDKIIHNDDRERVAKHFSESLMSPDVKSFEFRTLSPSGEERWVSHICQPVYGDDGQYLGRRASNRDITQRKKMEEALRQAHQALESRVEDRTLQLKITAKELKVRQAELLDHKRELERVNRELLETNRAVTVLARNIDKHRRDEENRFAKTITSKIIPLVEDLKKAKTLDSALLGLDIITTNVQDLSNDLTGTMNLLALLTPTELRVASMIIKGLPSQRIADKLCVSLHTIKFHRRNIRKKLNIQNSAINLESYLKAIMC
jgi:PAS domain S-box-containing protein